MKKSKVFLLCFSIMLFLTAFVSSQSSEPTHVISNSENWRDVYSTILYANLAGKGSDFLVSTAHGPILLLGISKNNNIEVITSDSVSFVSNYPAIIMNNGFAGASQTIVDSANLELIEKLPEIEDFIIVGNTFGYDAIAVAPYALKTNSWVFLADTTNIAEIESILEERDVNNLILYGYLDREVRDALEQYDPEVIFKGDRFQDNIEIVEKYLEVNPTKQVMFTNGEFIERGLMSGMDPILFTGKENVPAQIKEYLIDSDFEIGVLVGSDLVGTATNIRRDTGIAMIVKFARGARAPTGAVAAVEGLDLFPVPTPSMSLVLHSARYNAANSELHITYKSESNIPIYLLGTITPSSSSASRMGDDEPVFMAPNDFKTIIYEGFEGYEEGLEVNVFTLYGDTPSSLEKVLDANIILEEVNIIDGCSLDLSGAKYRKSKGDFVITLENNGDLDCWASVEIKGITIDSTKTTIGSEGSELIKSGKKGKVMIQQEITAEDIEDNPFVDVIAYYGEREDSLVKTVQGRLELEVESLSKTTIALIAAAVIIVLLIIYIRKRKEDDF